MMHARKFIVGFFIALLGTAPGHAQDYSEANLRQADAISGEQTWQQYCAFCHTLRDGEANISGPNLYRLFDRKVGSKPDYEYSDVLRNTDRDWTPEFFADYVQNPGATLPGNSMPAVDIPNEKVLALVAYVMRASESVDWDQAAATTPAADGLDAEIRSAEPEFWDRYMQDTIKFTLPRDNGEKYSFVAYFNEDGTITGNNRGLQGIWRVRDRRNFCYSLERVGVHPYEWMHCLRPKLTGDRVYGEVVDSFVPVKGHEDFKIDVSFLKGRPHPLEGDAHPDYWTFLFNNTTRYEIKVGGDVVTVDARFNEDNSITSPQGATGRWRTEGNAGKDDRMCYFMIDVPGVSGELSECFALVLMFNPRLGARWPSRFEQGNTYWAEIVGGRD